MQIMKYTIFLFVIIYVLGTLPVAAQLTRKLTLDDAKRIADTAEERARQDNWYVVIAVVDGGGHLISLRRIDGVQTASYDAFRGGTADR
jgi:glc operon protein GlcG